MWRYFTLFHLRSWSVRVHWTLAIPIVVFQLRNTAGVVVQGLLFCAGVVWDLLSTDSSKFRAGMLVSLVMLNAATIVLNLWPGGLLGTMLDGAEAWKLPGLLWDAHRRRGRRA